MEASLVFHISIDILFMVNRFGRIDIKDKKEISQFYVIKEHFCCQDNKHYVLMADGIYEVISNSESNIQIKKEIKFNKNYRKKLIGMAAVGFSNCCTDCIDLFKIFDLACGKHHVFRGFPFNIKASILPRRFFSPIEFDKTNRNFQLIRKDLLNNLNSNFRTWKILYFNEKYRNILNSIANNIWNSRINLRSFHGGVDTFSRIYSQLVEVADLRLDQSYRFCAMDDPEQVNKPIRGLYTQLFVFTLGRNCGGGQKVFAEIDTNFRQLEDEFYSKDTLQCLGLPLNIKINVFDFHKDLNCYLMQFLIEDFIYYVDGIVTWKSKDHLLYLLKKLFFVMTFIDIIKRYNKN